MRFVLNVLWLVLGGFFLALGYALAGIVCCLLVITIPFGLASFRMANFALWPFGRRLVDRPGTGVVSAVGNVLWILIAGWWLALGHLTLGVFLCLTIVGIPLGMGHFKLLPVSVTPLGRMIVHVKDAHTLELRR